MWVHFANNRRFSILAVGLVNELQRALRESNTPNEKLISLFTRYFYSKPYFQPMLEKNIPHSSSLKQAMESFDKTYEKINMFIALAFNVEYNNDQPTFMNYFYDAEDILSEFIDDMKNIKDLSFLDFALSPYYYEYRINELTRELIATVQITAAQVKSGQLMRGYLLVDQTIENLNLFKSMYPVNKPTILQNMNNLVRNNKFTTINTHGAFRYIEFQTNNHASLPLNDAKKISNLNNLRSKL